jgi:hypothetical protein
LRGLATNIVCSFGAQRLESSAAVRSAFWLTVLNEFRNRDFRPWLALGLQPAKDHENRVQVRMALAGAVRSNRASGAVEAEQLFDPERA